MLYKLVGDKERKPDSWRDSILIQIDKGKKDKADLANKRNIHTKRDIVKFFGHIVTNVLKEKIVENIPPFQIGAVPGHRAEEHLFTVNSFLLMVERNKTAVAIQQYDLSTFFDKESLLDCLNELYNSNIKGKVYKLIHELNKDTRITVRTPVGDSSPEELDEGMAKGSLDGAIVSSNSISKGLEGFFEDSEYEVSYGPLVLSCLSFQDDLFRLSFDPVNAQHGNDRLENLAETKLLNYNLTKTSITIVGEKRAREELRLKFENNNPTLYGKKVQIVDQATYLGDKLGTDASRSISLTIKK